jgi:hypothetical protein
MHPCPTCACHVHAADATCPHCGEPIGTRGNRTVAAAILALGLASCTGGPGTKTTGETGDTATTVQPLYGVTVTDTSTDTGPATTPEPEYGVTITTGDTGDTGDTATTGSTTGVDYGSPSTY